MKKMITAILLSLLCLLYAEMTANIMPFSADFIDAW